MAIKYVRYLQSSDTLCVQVSTEEEGKVVTKASVWLKQVGKQMEPVSESVASYLSHFFGRVFALRFDTVDDIIQEFVITKISYKMNALSPLS